MEDVRRVLKVESCDPYQSHALCLGPTYCRGKGGETLINAAARVESGREGVHGSGSGCVCVREVGGGSQRFFK